MQEFVFLDETAANDLIIFIQPELERFLINNLFLDKIINERGEINFPDDGYVSGLHARVTLRDGRIFLADLGSSNGTFIKVNGERPIGHESFVLLGQQLFRLNLA